MPCHVLAWKLGPCVASSGQAAVCFSVLKKALLPTMIAIGAGLCTAYQLILSVFRISTMEVDSYLTTALETSASVALTGVTHYLSTHTNSMVSSPFQGLAMI